MLQPFCPIGVFYDLVINEMISTINFNNQLFVESDKIGYIVADDMLSAELVVKSLVS